MTMEEGKPWLKTSLYDRGGDMMATLTDSSGNAFNRNSDVAQWEENQTDVVTRPMPTFNML